MKNLDALCRIGVGAFAAAMSPAAFSIAALVGCGVGAGMSLWERHKGTNSLVGRAKPICAQGFIEFLSGRKLPPRLLTVATSVYLAAHVRHDPVFFIPFTGLFIGMWMGWQVVSHMPHKT